MTNLRDYDRDAILIEKVRDLERQLADARESLDIAYAKGYDTGRTDLAAAQAEIEQMREVLQDFSNYVRDEQNSTDGSVQYSSSRIEVLAFNARCLISNSTDSTALHDRLRQERERCAKVCEANGNPGADGWSCAAKIRNMGDGNG